MLLKKIITISEINEILISTKENINKIIINQYNRIRNGIAIRLSKEILEKYKEVNKSFYTEINKIKKIRVRIQ